MRQHGAARRDQTGCSRGQGNRFMRVLRKTRWGWVMGVEVIMLSGCMTDTQSGAGRVPVVRDGRPAAAVVVDRETYEEDGRLRNPLDIRRGDGMLYDMRIDNRALNENEIDALYAAGKQR